MPQPRWHLPAGLKKILGGMGVFARSNCLFYKCFSLEKIRQFNLKMMDQRILELAVKRFVGNLSSDERAELGRYLENATEAERASFWEMVDVKKTLNGLKILYEADSHYEANLERVLRR
jgi:hypothetical protein